VDGTELTAESLKGKKVFLTFFRYAACPICNLRAAEIKQRYSGDSRVEVVMVFEATASSRCINNCVVTSLRMLIRVRCAPRCRLRLPCTEKLSAATLTSATLMRGWLEVHPRWTCHDEQT
jgi:hypothetical protein